MNFVEIPLCQLILNCFLLKIEDLLDCFLHCAVTSWSSRNHALPHPPLPFWLRTGFAGGSDISVFWLTSLLFIWGKIHEDQIWTFSHGVWCMGWNHLKPVVLFPKNVLIYKWVACLFSSSMVRLSNYGTVSKKVQPVSCWICRERFLRTRFVRPVTQPVSHLRGIGCFTCYLVGRSTNLFDFPCNNLVQ